MSRYDRQLAKQRADFQHALKRSRCPKCQGRILEVTQPDVVCEKCGVQFALAIQSGMFFLRTKLVEKGSSGPLLQQVAIPSATTSGRLCTSCGVSISEDSVFCNKCGTKL